MATWKVNNATSLGGEVLSQWQANHAYSLGARCVCTRTGSPRNRVFECTTGGTSGGSEPSWNSTVGNTTADNTVTWTTRDPTGTSWDNATLMYHAMDQAADGDIIHVHEAHDEKHNGYNVDLTLSSTVNNRIKIYCVDKTDDSLSSGAIFGTTHADTGYGLTLKGSFYSYGVKYTCAGGFTVCSTGYTHNHVTIQGTGPGFLLVEVGTVNANSYMGGGNFNTSAFELLDGDYKVCNAGNHIAFSDSVNFHWRNGVLVAPNECTGLWRCVGLGFIEDVDLSAMCTGATARNLVYCQTYYCVGLRLARCKLPSGSGFGWVYSSNPVMVPAAAQQGYVQAEQCSSANNVIGSSYADYFGTVVTETTIVKTDGASDGTTSFSWKMVSNANTDEAEGRACLVSPPLVGFHADANSQTITVDCIIDSATNLQDDEVWLEIHYPANNSNGLGSYADTQCARLGTPADVSSSTATWTTTGMSNPNEFDLSATVDPGKVGTFEVRICLAKPSTTIYVDPKAIVS